MVEISKRRGSLPKGHSYVPKGNVFITGHCRRRTQAAGGTVYAVVDNQGKKQIGIGVPTDIYLQVQHDEMDTRAERESNVQKRDEAIEKDFRKAIVQEYPRMPADVVPLVLKKALEKGKGKVGRTSTLDLSKKAVLAVRAHIRHVHTDYDALLRGGMGREEARREVATKVHDIDSTWKRAVDRISVRTARAAQKQQPSEPSTTRQTTGSSKKEIPLAKRVQAETPKPESPGRQLPDPTARLVVPDGQDITHTNECDATSVHPAMRKADETHRSTILDLISRIRFHERKRRRSGARLSRNAKSQDIKHRRAIVDITKKVNDLLEEAGLHRAETSTELGRLAEQLRLMAPEPTATSQILAPTGASTSQAQLSHVSARNRAVTRPRRSSGVSGNANIQHKTKVVVDLTGASDDDDMVLTNPKAETPQKHKEVVKRGMEAAWEVAGDQVSSATARELREELRELGVEDIVQALPRKRRAALEANRVLSRQLHSRRADREGP